MERKLGWLVVLVVVVAVAAVVLIPRGTSEEAGEAEPSVASVEPESPSLSDAPSHESGPPPAGPAEPRDTATHEPGSSAPDAVDEPFSPGGVVLLPDGSPAARVPVSLDGVTIIAGAQPQLETEELHRTETGHDGRFSFPDLERTPHSYFIIKAEADGYTHAAQQVVDYRSMPGRIPPGPEWEDRRRGQVTIQLHHAAEAAGRIVYEDGEPAGGVALAWAAQPGGGGDTWTPYGRMAVLTQGSVFPTTESDGTFRLEGLAAGTFALSATAGGEVLNDWLLEAPASGLELTVPRPPEPTTLRGRIVNADTEQGQAGVEFSLRWAGPPPEPSRMATPPSPGEPNLDMLRSMVRRSPAAISRMSREAATLRSGPGGEFELPGAVEGLYQAQLKEQGLYVLRIDTDAEDVRRMHSSQPFIAFEPGGGPVEIHVHEGRALHGRVLLTEPEEPLEGQSVHLLMTDTSPESRGFRRSHGAVTDGEGRFHFEGVDVASVYMVQLEGMDLARIMGGTSQVSTGGERYGGASIGDGVKLDGEEMVIRLRREGLVRVSVVHADGAPAHEAEVRVQGVNRGHLDESPPWHRVDVQGRTEVPVYMGMQYTVEARTMVPDAGAAADIRVPRRGEVPEVSLRLGAPGRVAGRVVGPEGRAHAGATVLLYPQQGHGTLRQSRQDSTTTSADGRFHFEMVPKGKYGLSANAEGGSLVTTDSPPVEIADGEDRTGIELRLVRKDFTLRGRVLDGEERPIEGVRVTVGTENTATGSDGRFTIEGLLPTMGYLQLQKEGYTASMGAHNYQPVEEEQVFTMGRLNQRRLIVQVRDAATERPVEGLRVTRGHGSHSRDIAMTPTGFEYEFQIQQGQATTLTAYLDAPGYPVTPHHFTLDGEEDPIVREVRLRRGETLRGRVVRFGADSPMEGVHVSVRPRPEAHAGQGGRAHAPGYMQSGTPGDLSMRTGADGYFVFQDVPPTSGSVRVDAAAGPNQYLDVAYEFPERGPLDMGEIVLGERPELVVRLVALGSGEPIPGQEVTFQPQPRGDGMRFDQAPQNGTTDEAGRVSFGPQFALRGTIRTGAKQQQAELPDGGGVHEVLVELGRAAAGIRLTRDPAPGLSRPGISATVENEHFQGSHQPDSDGVRWVENLPGGEVRVRASFSFPADPFAGGSAGNTPFRQRNNYMARTWTLELGSTERRVLDLTPPAGTIEGRVELASGHDMEDVFVELQIRRTVGLLTNDWGGTRHARPEADGTYRIEHVPPGEHTLTAEHPILGSDSRGIEMPEDGTLREDFALLTPERGTLVSIVFSAETGEPLPGARLSVRLPESDASSSSRVMPRWPYQHSLPHDEEGVLLLPGLDAGGHRAWVTAPDFQNRDITFEIKAGETTYLDTELEPIGTSSSESSPGDPFGSGLRRGVRQ